MIDRDGNELAVGDRVAYCSSRYAELYIGYIVAITPKKVRVSSNRCSTGGEIKDPRMQVVKLAVK